MEDIVQEKSVGKRKIKNNDFKLSTIQCLAAITIYIVV